MATSQNTVDAAVAEHDLPVLGQAEQVLQALTHGADEVLHRRLAVRAAEQVAVRLGQREHLLGAHLGGTAPEPAVDGQQVVGDGDVA